MNRQAMLRTMLSVVILSLGLSGCTWVKLTPSGEKARVLSAAEVTSCKRTGQTTVSLKSQIAGVDRNKEKVQTELNTLARNAAADLKGDTVVPVSEPKDGKQVFDVYRCINP